MFSTIVSVAALAGAVVNAAPLVEREQFTPPAGWATGYLEKYDTYHLRYLALDCQDKHNTTFFDDCCHPLLATENLKDNRKAYCNPDAAAYSSAYAEATATTSADAVEESVYSSAVASYTSAYTEAATSSPSAAQQQIASPTSSSEAPAATSDSSSAPSGDVKTGGYATYFYQGGNAGACGNYNSDSTPLVAIDSNGYWQNFNSGGPSSLCGKSLTIKNNNNGKTVVATVQDVCPTCANDNSLDLSVGAFTAIASEGEGMVPITWWWN